MTASITPLSLTDMMETKMLYDGERQKVLAQNIANKDIPGYQAQDLKPLDFKNVLAAQTSKLSMATTSPNHIGAGKQHTAKFLATTDDKPFEIAPTGNSVTTEEQMMKVAQNSMDYQMSVNLYTKINSMVKEALDIQGGGA